MLPIDGRIDDEGKAGGIESTNDGAKDETGSLCGVVQTSWRVHKLETLSSERTFGNALHRWNDERKIMGPPMARRTYEMRNGSNSAESWVSPSPVSADGQGQARHSTRRSVVQAHDHAADSEEGGAD